MKLPTTTNEFSSYHFQSELTVGNTHVEPNKKEYLTDWANRLNKHLNNENFEMELIKRAKFQSELLLVLNNINS